MGMGTPISVCMLAKDEAGKIRPALQSARACAAVAEIVVFDSGSTDGTVEIARELADRVEHREWVDFTTNRQAVVDAANHDHVLVLDADEELSPELAAEIVGLTDDQFAAHPVFTMPRKNYLLGRHVVAWDPDRVARLFDRTRITWPKRTVHDRPKPTRGTVGRLNGPLYHNRMANDFGDYFDGERYQARADALAEEMYERGTRCGYIEVLFNPLVAFGKSYLLKGGALQGTFGLLVAQKSATFTQLKYARLWQLQRERKRGGS